MDGLRFFAVLLVILHHITGGSRQSFLLHLVGIQNGNGIGSPLFFVLSGTLLTMVVHSARHTSNRYVDFLRRRALRILPLYLGYLALAATVTLLVTGAITHKLWVYAFFAQNILIRASEQTNSIVPMHHLWTIAVQDQFYLLWPLLLWRCRSLRQMRALCCAGILVSFLSRAILLAAPVTPELVTRSLPAISECMFLGALVALEQMQPTRFGHWLRKALLPLALASLAWMWIGLDYATVAGSLGGFQLIGLTCASLVACAMQRDTMLARTFSGGLFVFGGRKLAYGLYMFHPWMLTLCIDSLPFGSKPIRLAIFFASTFALAHLSYRYYERPFLKQKAARLPQPAPAAKEVAPAFSGSVAS